MEKERIKPTKVIKAADRKALAKLKPEKGWVVKVGGEKMQWDGEKWNPWVPIARRPKPEEELQNPTATETFARQWKKELAAWKTNAIVNSAVLVYRLAVLAALGYLLIY